MTTYPLEFYRRAEEKWRRRAGPLRASERPSRTARASRHQSICIDRAALITKGGLPPPREGDDILPSAHKSSKTIAGPDLGKER
jgi:hypothetical protein